MDKNISKVIEERRKYRSPDERDSSWDYCFKYFQSFSKDDRPSLENGSCMQLSCLQLGFYLASWGMYRGSAPIHLQSVKYLEPVIQMIAREENLWETDVNTYEKDGIDLIINFANKLRVDWGKDWNRRPSDILITKIMLGVFGCVPAFDTYFKKGFGVSSLNKNSLNGISKYYSENKQIDNYLDYVTDFKTGKPFKGKFKYTRARVIDLVFFDIGGGNK